MNNDAKLDELAVKTVALGLDVEAFLHSPVGRYLVQRAEAERAAALEKLKDADAEDAKAIRRYQHQVGVIDAIQQWLADAIHDAHNAEQQLFEQQD